jgi:hypothetical protein
LTQDEILRRLAAQQRQRAKTLRRLAKLRERASAEIERLLEFLNASDEYVQTELEQDDLDEDDGTENEPSLGALDRPMNQNKAWADTRQPQWLHDCEHDNCDDEANGDKEPSLGWCRGGAIGDTNDLET